MGDAIDDEVARAFNRTRRPTHNSVDDEVARAFAKRGSVDVRGGMAPGAPGREISPGQKMFNAAAADLANNPDYMVASDEHGYPLTRERVPRFKGDVAGEPYLDYSRPKPSIAETALHKTVNGATMGFGKKLAAGVSSLLGRDTYDNSLDTADQLQRDASAAHPVVAPIAEIAGAGAVGRLPGLNPVRGALTPSMRVAQTVGNTSLQAGLASVGNGRQENANDAILNFGNGAVNAIPMAAAGSVAGELTSGLGKGLEKWGYRRAVGSYNPTKMQLKTIDDKIGVDDLGRFIMENRQLKGIPGASTLESRAAALKGERGAGVGQALTDYDAAAAGQGGFPMQQIPDAIRSGHVGPLQRTVGGGPMAGRLEGAAADVERIYGLTSPTAGGPVPGSGKVVRAFDPVHDTPSQQGSGFDAAHGVPAAPDFVTAPGSAGAGARSVDPVHDTAASPPKYSIRDAQKVKSELYDQAFSPDALALPSKSPVKQNVAGVGSTVKRLMENEVRSKLGDERAESYISDKDAYAKAKLLEALAAGRGNQELSNRWLSLTDYGAGGLAEGLQSELEAGRIPRTAKQLAIAIAHRTGRLYGGPIAAKGAVYGGQAGQVAGPVLTGISRGVAADPEEREALLRWAAGQR